MANGALNKVVLLFDKCFWPEDQYTFAHLSTKLGEYPMLVNLMKETNGKPILVFMVGGDEGLRIEHMTDEEVKTEAMQVIRSLFGTDTRDPISIFVTVSCTYRMIHSSSDGD
jgi:monoamine oxidase